VDLSLSAADALIRRPSRDAASTVHAVKPLPDALRCLAGFTRQVLFGASLQYGEGD
jgi:hypothetical protein